MKFYVWFYVWSRLCLLIEHHDNQGKTVQEPQQSDLQHTNSLSKFITFLKIMKDTFNAISKNGMEHLRDFRNLEISWGFPDILRIS